MRCAQKGRPMPYAVVVTFAVKPEAYDDFMPVMLSNAHNSKTLEPDCHQFDVATDPARPFEVFLYELYTNRAGFEAHMQMDHYKLTDATVGPMLLSKDVRTYEVVAQ